MLSFHSVAAQWNPDAVICGEKARHRAFVSSRSAGNVDHGYQINYHRCYWRVNPHRNGYLTGKVVSKFTISRNTDSINFDLHAQMTVDSVYWRGTSIPFKRQGHVLSCPKPGGWKKDETDSITIWYRGNPQVGGTGYYTWDMHATGPIVSTVSQPYGAMYWWPCKQTLSDKIDSIDIFISTTPDLKAASNGMLISSDSLNDSTRIFHWKHRYPIVTYLVAIAVSNYSIIEQTVGFYNRSETVPVQNFVFPQSVSDANRDLPATVPVMRLFDSLFGEYPFAREKYGHAQFTWGGGMEHQTMSFMVNYSYDLLAHELAHQWFGDMVTCGSWADLWLNEGFATYLNVMCYEFLQPAEWLNRLHGLRNAATQQDDGSVLAKDTVTINKLFSGTLTYSKGAFLLHMLRNKIGDAAFFGGLNKYITLNHTNYGFALTRDLQSVLEQESGMNLDTFFLRWYKGEGFPYLKINWQQSGKKVSISIEQTPSHPSVPFFELRIPIMFRNDTDDTLIFIEPKRLNDVAVIELPFAADSALFDPYVTLLAKASLGGINLDKTKNGQFTIAPNPVSETLRIISHSQTAAKLEIFDCHGARVYTTPGTFRHISGEEIVIPVSEFAEGIYSVRIFSGDSVTLYSFIKPK